MYIFVFDLLPINRMLTNKTVLYNCDPLLRHYFHFESKYSYCIGLLCIVLINSCAHQLMTLCQNSPLFCKFETPTVSCTRKKYPFPKLKFWTLMYAFNVYLFSPRERLWRHCMEQNKTLVIITHVYNFCVFSHAQKGILGLTHKGCIFYCLSFDKLSDITVVLEMRQSIGLDDHV